MKCKDVLLYLIDIDGAEYHELLEKANTHKKTKGVWRSHKYVEAEQPNFKVTINYPEEPRFSNDLIGICVERCNLMVNEEFCLRCRQIYFPCNCGGDIEHKSFMKASYNMEKIICKKCKKEYSEKELQEHYKKNLKKENDYFEFMREDLIVETINLDS